MVIISHFQFHSKRAWHAQKRLANVCYGQWIFFILRFPQLLLWTDAMQLSPFFIRYALNGAAVLYDFSTITLVIESTILKCTCAIVASCTCTCTNTTSKVMTLVGNRWWYAKVSSNNRWYIGGIGWQRMMWHGVEWQQMMH